MNKNKKLFLSVLLMASLVMSVFANGSKESKDDGGLKFAFLPNTQNNTFQSTMNDTFRKECEENGISYTCLDPDYDLNTQLNQLSDAATQKYDMVFVISCRLQWNYCRSG